MSIYGSQLWKFNRFSNVNKFYIAWRKTVRRIWNLQFAENVNFFVYKCNFTYHDWFGSLNVILKKIECYVIKCSSIVDICTATAIRELCHERVPDRYDYWVII